MIKTLKTQIADQWQYQLRMLLSAKTGVSVGLLKIHGFGFLEGQPHIELIL